jgi:ClpP class serine protease
MGRRFALYDERPGPECNEPFPSTLPIPSQEEEEDTQSDDLELPGGVTIVRVSGPLEQRAGSHGECGGWCDGHDAVAERLISAFGAGDVVLIVDSPGGAHAGLQEAIRKVLKEKKARGRFITAYADEMIGSAAYWWVACVADEIYAPESAIIGSIGARSAHVSVAGALKKAGQEVTYFAAPGPGKIAFAPEFPLSDIGRARGERDTQLAFDSFAKDVSKARGISRKDIEKLDADALPAPLALDANLIDGIASLDEVLALALARAGKAENGN